MLPNHNDLLVHLYNLSPDRRAATRYIDSLRNQFTPPTKGELVGTSGPDYSFRLADIPNDEFGRRGNFPTYKLLRELIQPNAARARINGYEVVQKMSYSKHMMLDVVATTKSGIIRWTQWAKANDVRHNGKWGYSFPRKRVWNTSPETFGSLHTICARLNGKRSENARRRRSEKRKLLSKARSVPAVVSPIVERLERSQTSLRKTWFSMVNRPTWKKFLLHTTNRKIRCIGPVPRHRTNIPPLVELSLLRIYSRFEYTHVVKHDVLKPPDVVVDCVPGGYNRADLVRMLEEIERNGFHETYSWFALNHLLYEKSVENT